MRVQTRKSTPIEQSEKIVQADQVTFLDQFRMGLFAGKDPRLSACDRAVLDEITDRIIKRTGLSIPTGITHLVRETGRHSRSIRDSIRRLLDFQYLIVATKGAGTRGTEYRLNLPWVRHVSALVDAEIERRKSLKRSSSSVRLPNHTSSSELACAETASLDDDDCAETASLRSLVCVPAPIETYVGPALAGTYVGEEFARLADGGLAAAPRAANQNDVVQPEWVTITDARMGDPDDYVPGVTMIVLEFSDGTVEEFVAEADTPDVQDERKEHLDRLLYAMDVRDDADSIDQLPGKACWKGGVPVNYSSTYDLPKNFPGFVPPETYGQNSAAAI